MYQRYRKFVLQMYRRLRHPRILKNNRVMRWFAKHYLDKEVWRPTRHRFAAGVAVGAFFNALVLPGQMPLAAFICGIFRFNIPIAMAMCILSNPFTTPAIAWWEVILGNWIIDTLNLGESVPLRWSQLTLLVREIDSISTFFKSVKPWAASLYVGGVVAGTVCAIVCYLIAYGLWDLFSGITSRAKRVQVKKRFEEE